MSTSHEALSSSKLAADLNLPSRPPTASTPLWAHILRPNSQVPTSLSDVRVVAPPTVPLDKNATSMRVLLHDTQANFEKFTNHVTKLTEGIKETKHEMKTVHSLFERDRESLMGDIIDLVNRVQKEIQKCVGSPCQTETVATFFKDITHRLQGLDQRLEAMQSFNQTHSQALQTQIQAIQILLDKQGSIVTAVLPLLPLLQAVPLHIDAAKNDLKEAIAKLATATPKIKSSLVSSRGNRHSVSPSPRTTGKRKRNNEDGRQISTAQSSNSPSHSSPILSAKRPRRENSPNVSPASLSKSDEPPSFPRQPPALPSSPSIPVPAPHGNDGGAPPPSGFSPAAVVAASPSCRPGKSRSTLDRDKQGTLAAPVPALVQDSAFATPRRPLADLQLPLPLDRTSRPPSVNRCQQGPVFPPLLRTPSTTVAIGTTYTSVSELFGTRARTSSKADLEKVERQLNRSAPAARPPRMLRMHTSLATRNNPNPAAAIGAQSSSVTITPANIAPSESTLTPLKAGLQVVARENLLGRRQNTSSPLNVADHRSSPLGLGGHNMGTRIDDLLSRSRSRSGSVSRAVPVDPLAIFNRHPTPAPIAEAPKQENAEHDTAVLPPPQKQAQVQPTAARSRSRSASVLSVCMAVPRPKGKNIPLAAALGRMKERRSPVKDGRRFIPLMDSEDDDDD